jgi:hypothetical protein
MMIPSSSSGAPISNPGESAEPFGSHNRRSRASLQSHRRELPASRILTTILHQHSGHQLIERSFPSALTNHTDSGDVESRQRPALIAKPPRSSGSRQHVPVPWVSLSKNGRLFRNPKTTSERRSTLLSDKKPKEILEFYRVAFKSELRTGCQTPGMTSLARMSEIGKGIVLRSESTRGYRPHSPQLSVLGFVTRQFGTSTGALVAFLLKTEDD